MIQKVTVYQVICDSCGKAHVNESLGYCALVDGSGAVEDAFEAGLQEAIKLIKK